MEDNNYVDFEEAQPEKKNRTVIIIAVVAVVLCCCCSLIGYVAWTYGDQIINTISY
jgi:hypothetical protein